MGWLTERFKWLNQVVYYNKVSDWLITAGIAIGLWLAIALVVWLMRRYVGRHRDSEYEEAVPRRAYEIGLRTLVATRWYFYAAMALHLGSKYLMLPHKTREIVDTAAIIVLLVQIAVWVQAGLAATLSYWSSRQPDESDTKQMAAAGVFVGKLAIWTLTAMLVLSNLGVEISALLAAVGVGGIAAALAIQSTLGDLLSAFSLYMDRPFRIGDFVIVGELLGTVEKIGMRTTRIRSLGGELVVCPNSDLATARIANYKRMRERRILFTFGVVYRTLYEKLIEIPEMVREIIEADCELRFDRCHFKEYGDYSLTFEVVYFVLSPDYNRYMDKQQYINLEIFRRFQEAGIEFAFPTHTVHLSERPAASPQSESLSTESNQTRDADLQPQPS